MVGCCDCVIVNALRERGYLTVADSEGSGQEKVVALTPRALYYLAALGTARRQVDLEVRHAVGDETLSVPRAGLACARSTPA
jgi:hypothetical protein